MNHVVEKRSELDELAETINAEHCNVELAVRRSLEYARKAGEHLLKAKALVEWGHWLDWIYNNLDCSERSAQAYMQIAKSWEKLELKTQDTADLSIQKALQMIAKAEKLEAKEPIKSALQTGGQHECAFVQPTYEIDGDEIVVTKNEGEQYAMLTVSPKPTRPADSGSFVTGLTQVVHRLESLADEAMQLVQLQGEFQRAVPDLISDARSALEKIGVMANA